jgi:hypothetical protein
MVGGEDPEIADFKTVLPRIEIDQRLLKALQKDMSDKTYDVKLYEIKLKSMPACKKLRFEIFWVDDPSVVFRCDYFSQSY